MQTSSQRHLDTKREKEFSDHQPVDTTTLSLFVLPSRIMALQWSVVFLLLALACRAYGQGLSEEEKEEILNAHNHYRGLVDPIATNMLTMVRDMLLV